MIRISLVQTKVPERDKAQTDKFALGLKAVAEECTRIPWRRKFSSAKKLTTHDFLLHLVTDSAMIRLNAGYRNKHTTTDVLSFSYLEDGAPVFAHEAAGEIYISLPQAKRQARLQGHTLADELKVLTVHGVLHLMGYDHEAGVAEANKMHTHEKRILAALGDGGAAKAVKELIDR